LIELWRNRAVLGFEKTWYWSSTEVDNFWKLAWAVNFAANSNAWDTWKKNNLMRVRACRYF